MKSVFDDSSIELTCPDCGRKLPERLSKLKTDPTLTCTGCGASIRVDANQLKLALKEADKRVADFGKALRDFNKKR